MDRSPPQSPPQPPPEAASPDPATPPRVPGDDKDWTWVLERRCPECRFDAATVDPGDVAGLLRANARSWLSVLAGDEDRVRRRPSPDVWSALEYAAHVRDVHRLYLERLELMLEHDGPHYPNWDQDETAVISRYDLADPESVSVELFAAAEMLADRFDDVAGDQWDRTGFRSDGAAFTVASFGRYFIHDPIHHLHDAEVGFRRMTA